MAGGKTDALELLLLNAELGAAAYAPPATQHVALFSASPTDAGGGTELTGSGYARVGKTNNATNFPGGNPKSNGTTIDFPAATADWLRALAWGLFDAATGGTLRYWGPLAGVQLVGRADAAGNTITRDAHGLANGNVVRVFGVRDAALPAGLALDTRYFVVGATADTFQVSLTVGGAAVDITANGFLEYATDQSIVIAAGGNASFAVGQLIVDET